MHSRLWALAGIVALLACGACAEDGSESPPVSADGCGCGIGEACDAVTGECFALECLMDSGCALGQTCTGGLCIDDPAADRDGDGFPDDLDVCPEIQDISQEDSDGDGPGDACDLDDDNDAIPDTIDNCPLAANPDQFDRDNDRQGNLCDPDYNGMTLLGRLTSPTPDLNWPQITQVVVSGTAGAADGVVDSGGRFTASGLEPGLYNIDVTVDGHQPANRGVQLDGNGDFQMPPIALIPL